MLRIRIAGRAAPGGGVTMTRSAVTLGPRRDPGEWQGRIDALSGSSLEALVGSGGGAAVRLRVDLNLGAARGHRHDLRAPGADRMTAARLFAGDAAEVDLSR